MNIIPLTELSPLMPAQVENMLTKCHIDLSVGNPVFLTLRWLRTSLTSARGSTQVQMLEIRSWAFRCQLIRSIAPGIPYFLFADFLSFNCEFDLPLQSHLSSVIKYHTRTYGECCLNLHWAPPFAYGLFASSLAVLRHETLCSYTDQRT